jgi:hypothetical protein
MNERAAPRTPEPLALSTCAETPSELARLGLVTLEALLDLALGPGDTVVIAGALREWYVWQRERARDVRPTW